MKRTFLAKRNALLSSRDISWGAYAMAFSIGMLLFRLLMPNLFWQAFAPAFRLSETIAAGSHVFLSGFGTVADLTLSNEGLAEKNRELAAQNALLVQRDKELLALLGGNDQKRISAILAGVVTRPPQSPYDVLVLAAGERDGVVLGMEAFGSDSTPIGIVSEVSAGFSRVTLFSAPGMETGGWVGHASVPVTLHGAGAGVLAASVSRVANIRVGDPVFVPGPGMLPVGSVVRVDTDSISSGATLRIAPIVNPFSVAWVVLRATGMASSVFATSTTP